MLAGLAAAAAVGAALAGGCARTIVYACGVHRTSEKSARIAVHASKRSFDFELVAVTGPGRGGGMCSPPSYAFGPDAMELELQPGVHDLMAKAQRSGDPWAFPIRGEVSIEPGRCYAPEMVCDRDPPDGGVCRLTLATFACPPRWFPKRQVVSGLMGC